MTGLVILTDEQLRQLARIIYYQEVEAINNIKFQSEPEQAKYLRDSKANYESVLGLLDAGGESKRKFENDNTRAPIAHDIFSYIVRSTNNALQSVRNYTLRLNYLDKISTHAKQLISELKKLDPADVASARHLAEEAVQYEKVMLEYTKKHQSVRSRNFSKWLKEKNLTFEGLVQRYQKKLKFDGPFKDLKDVQKLQVYEEIIEASGRGRVIGNLLSHAFGVFGIAVLLFTAGMMVWDIFSSEHILQTATHDVVVTIASVGGAMLGEVVGTALATALVGVEASPLFVLMAGIVGGIAGAFILMTLAGWLIDLIFRSGGSAPLSTDGHRCYVASMPNGEVLARQILHQHKLTN